MTTEGGLRQCLTDLTRADTSGDYQKALQAANRIIRRYPREHYAFKCKLVCLIHLSMYDDALTLLKKTPPSQMGECAFEKAYILYRLDKNVEALEILETCGRSDHRALELRAQLYYRLDKFQEALEIFRDLLRNHSDSYDEERKANYIAVLAQLEALGLKQQTSTDNESFEQLYNAACHLIEAGNHELALSSLNKAIDLCRETLSEEGLDEEEIEDELAVLRVQRAYVLHKLGRKKEAIDIYKDLQAAGIETLMESNLFLRPSDVGVMATLANNMAGAIEDQGIADSRRKLKSALQLDKSKLSTRQRRILMLNNALVLLHSNQREPCRRALDDLVKIFGSSRETRLLEAALYFRLNEFEKAIKNLENGDIQMEMIRIHLMVNSGNFEGAVDALKNLPIKLRLKPALVSLAVSLLVSIDRKDDALELINEAIEHMSDLKIREQMLDQAATLESSKGNMAAAAVYLEKLHEVNPTDIRVICRLIRAYTDCNPQKAEQLSTQVFPETVDEKVDVDNIEESDWILYGEKYKQKKEAKSEIEDTEIVTKKLKNRKRKRKIRLPKNFDPNVPPDPERWLPKQERAAYKKRQKKNRDRDIGRGTQGSVSTNPNVEYVTASPSSPRPATTVLPEGPRQMRPKQQPKKKKKPSKF